MPLYCPECGNSLAENFKFCPECGKNLKGSFNFCPDCGKKMPITNEIEQKETITEEPQPKKEKTKFKFPKISIKIPKKTMIILLAIICIIVVVVAAAIVLYPGETTETTSGGRTFTITIRNDFSSSANCYLLTDNLKQGVYGNPGFVVNANGIETFNITEDDLMFQREDYVIKLFVTINDVQEVSTADAVTESANFVIDNYEDQVDEFYVNCTGYL